MKIKCIKDKIHGFMLISGILFLVMLLPFLTSMEIVDKIVIFGMILVVYFIVVLCYAVSLEWYIIDESGIVVRNIFYTINKVDFNDVKLVYKKRLPVFTRDEGIYCLLFDDGRKENIGIFTGSNVDNHKKCRVRIPYSEEVMDYLMENHPELSFLNIDTLLETNQKY
ncbi:MAG: hypothetical protein E7678_07295 [Ruminococcaceae bacterium]|nr:hypothetical protein [Oscillospiraceae bacterium]